MRIIETDARGETVLVGRPNEQFMLHENSDGSVMLTPVDNKWAQQEHDETPELQELLRQAAASNTVKRTRRSHL